MSQYQPPQGDAQGYGQQPGYGQPVPPAGGYGQASVPQPQGTGSFGQGSVPQQAAPGYGQASAPQQAGGFDQEAGGFAPQPGGYPQHGQGGYAQQPGAFAQQSQGGPGYGAQYPTSGNPGLFDTTFAVSSTQQTAKLAYIAVIIFAGVLALTAIFRAIGQFSAVRYGGVSSVLGGLTSLILYGALAFGVLTVGRLVIDFFVQEDKKRQQR